MKKTVVLVTAILMLCGSVFGSGLSSLLYLTTSVLPLNTLAFYQGPDDESSSFENNTLSMGDATENGNTGTAYLVVRTNNPGILTLSVTLPAMEWIDDDSNTLATGSTLDYTTAITKYAPTDDGNVTLSDDVSGLSNSGTAKQFGTINGANGTKKVCTGLSFPFRMTITGLRSKVATKLRSKSRLASEPEPIGKVIAYDV